MTAPPTRRWLACLALLCAVQLVLHTGRHSGFVESSRPLYSVNDTLPGQGYVTWVGAVPVLHDADAVLTLTALFLGERDTQLTGIYDRRASYPYLAALTIPWAGAYAGFMLVNLAFWWGAAASCYWLVRRRWGDPWLAMAASLLVAAGNGFVFMAGEAMSYVGAYAAVMLALALTERLEAFGRGATWRSWLLLGWAGGVASTLYFTHVPLLLFWWLYGLRRVPWRFLVGASAVTLGISFGWELFGRALGLNFATDNSALVGASLGGWLHKLTLPWSEVLTYVRGGSLAGAAAIRPLLTSTFPLPWWILAAAGFLASSDEDRGWSVALFIAGLLPGIILLALLPLPRVTYHMYPVLALLAARGALVLGRLAASWLGAWRWFPGSVRLRPALAAGISLAALLLLVAASNADVLGYPQFVARFHEPFGTAE